MNVNPRDLFAVLANTTRLRCLILLTRHEELCVCELTQAIGASQPHISRHLANLREAGLVADRREGLWIYYRIAPDLPAWVTGILHETIKGNWHLSPYSDDEKALAVMPNRPGAPRCA
jgi:ArsR family transcriptional regulator, arsenate/arsenite/antimonite-responsive transcriptional repressor